MNSSEQVRECAVCGSFYPSDPAVLKRQVISFLGTGPEESEVGSVRGLLSPHAGYEYSGQTAGAVYRRLRGTRYGTVVVVSPSHREFFDGISLYSGDAYATPLGRVRVNADLREKLLASCPHARSSEEGHGEEHAIEVQLPFLQEVLKEFTILPIVMGHQKREYCYSLGEALGKTLKDENALLVASTDLSHYHPAKDADRLDSVFIEDVKNADYGQLMDDLEDNKTEACGGGPTVAVLIALHTLKATRVKVVHHCNSGDVTGDRGSVVGYLAAVAYA
ncbi:MAG: AmmeMemoRadiSam system protein B [Bacteroidota bacterium]